MNSYTPFKPNVLSNLATAMIVPVYGMMAACCVCRLCLLAVALNCEGNSIAPAGISKPEDGGNFAAGFLVWVTICAD